MKKTAVLLLVLSILIQNVCAFAYEYKPYIGEDAVLEVTNVPDQDVMIGIRPEGFILDENGRRWDCMWEDDEIVGICKYF